MASTMPIITCQRGLSDLGGTVFITTIQYEYSKDHHWDRITTKNAEQSSYAHQRI